MDLRSKIIRLAHQNPALRPHLLPLLKEAGDVIQFRPPVRNPHTVTIAGTKYVLSNDWPAMSVEDEDGPGAKVVRFQDDNDPWKYLWVYDLDKQVLAMWRVTDGNEKEHGPASRAQSFIVKLDKKGQLNRVTHNQFQAIAREMSNRERDHMQALEAWVEELKTDAQRDVDQLVKDYFDKVVRPVMDQALSAVESGVVPLGFKATPGGFPVERQMKSYVLGQIYERLFNLDKVDDYVRSKGVDLDSIDQQATQWARDDVWMDYAKSALR